MSATSPPVPPIVCDEHGDVTFHASVQEAANDVEPVDVRNAEYEFFDSLGARLTATTDGETVTIERSVETTEEPGELQRRLRAFIHRVGPARVGLPSPDAAQLDELVLALHDFLRQ